ncbi:MAG: Gfo/Idh/MocA family oxidoreductase [Opitutales bacterium]|nr:Gfo/Idh/MocA family oxidoreductase [Opitutales bacterium]
MNENSTPSGARQPIRIALIGVTGYALAYFEDLNKLVDSGRAQWAAVTVINPEQAPDQMQFFKDRKIPVFADYREMLDKEQDNIDWVCIPTAIGWHTQMTIDCLRLGKQVLVEKPLAPTLQDVDAIRKVEKETGISICVGFQHTYLEETWDLKRRLLDGEIGEVKRVDCIALWPRSTNYYARNNWAGQLHDGHSWVLDSPLHNGLSHMVNLILFWTGSELDKPGNLVRVSSETYRAKPIESFDTIRTVAEMANGIEAAVILTHSNTNAIDPEIRITGTNGTLVWRFRGHHSIYTRDGDYSIKTPGLLRIREIMFETVLDRIEGKGGYFCSTEIARGTAKWVNAVHDAAPIHEVPQIYRQHVDIVDGESYDTIQDMEYYGIRSYLEKCAFADLGAPWAVQPRSLNVRDYNNFEARYCDNAALAPQAVPMK